MVELYLKFLAYPPSRTHAVGIAYNLKLEIRSNVLVVNNCVLPNCWVHKCDGSAKHEGSSSTLQALTSLADTGGVTHAPRRRKQANQKLIF